jgi:hypothetical protein
MIGGTELSSRPLGLLERAIATGSLAGLATTATLALLGRRQIGSAAAPINATSHVLWGDEAGTADAVDVKHTAPGVLINSGAGIFWAFVRELVSDRLPRQNRATAVATGAAVAGLAYLVDYHVIPRRLTPGWELRLPRRSVALGFVALGAALAIATLVQRNDGASSAE